MLQERKNQFCRTNVNNVTLTVEHNVAVVSVFELKQKRQQTVAGHTHDEVTPSLHEKFSLL